MPSYEYPNKFVPDFEEPPKTGFEIPPPPIPAQDLKKTYTADVVVIGCGISGMCAAISAAENGAKVILVEKTGYYNQRGGHNAALHSKLQKAAGIKVDRDQVVATIMEWGGYRANQDVVTAWADNCSDAMDWLIDMAEKSGIKVILEPTTKDWYFPNYPTIHAFRPRHQETLAEMLIANCKARGVEFHFNSPAVQLIREDKGRVTGVIAKDPENGYARFDANKGVIICTGDYGNDKEMVKKYCWPIISQLQSEYTYTVKSRQIINTGDGHKMGIWIGAAIDDPPHCALLFDWSSWAGWDSPYVGLFLLGRQPWLHVNIRGERFMNEDLPWAYEAAQRMRQPGMVSWSVWDSKWEQEWPKMHSQCCKNMMPQANLWHPEQFESEIKQGHVLVAGSLEELAQKMEIPVDTFKATVARYNELAGLGKDLDYGKHPDRLTTLEKPPFYTCKMDARYLVILAGLQINTRMQVLDTEGKVIPGLYAAGNASGSFFAYQYPTTVPGATHSRAFTFGRLAGRNAALGLS